MAHTKKNWSHFIVDVDGVLSTGQFLYTAEGKMAKLFGPHDHDGLKLLAKKLEIRAISADKRGFDITKKRVVDDMNIPLELVSEDDRLKWLKKNFDLASCIYMGDGITDAKIFPHVAYSIAPISAFYLAKEKADFVTRHAAGEGAVAEACLHIIDNLL